MAEFEVNSADYIEDTDDEDQEMQSVNVYLGEIKNNQVEFDEEKVSVSFNFIYREIIRYTFFYGFWNLNTTHLA
jgi:hypothetical protein